ncbi:P94 [Agrotis ipsilon multiple nucleopolyhedrovirus]|uniref:p94 n=1 Tax=Agrotis ipsilon multiple nucleopolyhedrovirus TaxID=208013 RepID=B6D629_9ABAC|nr:P94 [Agrotis ipsilon multiple nucleopolyhedrovirus]ACI28816.1 P94 [Agrotis ipsilon multiple nucleopolyhedrovirus]
MFFRRAFNMLFGNSAKYDIMNDDDVNDNHNVNDNDNHNVNDNNVNDRNVDANNFNNCNVIEHVGVSDTKRYDYYVYASDNSYSTYYSKHYYENALLTLEDFKSIVDNMKCHSKTPAKIVYLQWGSHCYEASEKDVRIHYMKLKGNNGVADPESFIDWIKYNVLKDAAKLQLLYIVTNTKIRQDKVRKIDLGLSYRGFVFNHVIFQAIDARVENIDMSVAAVLIRQSKCKLYRNRVLEYDVDLSDQFNYDDITVDNYYQKKTELTSYIKLKFFNVFVGHYTVLLEINKLKNLRSTLIKEYAKRTESLVQNNFESKDRRVFINEFKNSDYYKMLYFDNNKSFNKDVDKLISALINYLRAGNKSFEFDSLRVKNYFWTLADARNRGGNDDDDDLENFYNSFDAEFEYENVTKIDFPDSESEVPALILTHADLLESLSNNALAKFKQYNVCPLYYLENEEMRLSVEYYYSLESFRMLLKHDIRVSPRTRKNFSGALVPLPQFDDYNDWVLAVTYFNGKCVPYNKGLMYYVLYKHMLNAEHIDDVNVIEYFRQYAVHRIEQTKCPMSLTHLPLEPTMTVSLPAALWYCVDISTQLFGRDPIFFGNERLSAYAHFADDMLAMLRWCGYSMDVEAISQRAELFRAIIELKRRGQRHAKLLYILEQVFETRDGFLVHKFKNKRAIKKLNYLSIDYTKMIDEHQLEQPINLNDYVLFYDLVNGDDEPHNPIVVETMRPKFSYNSTTSYYDLLLSSSYSVSANANNDIEIKPNAQNLNIRKILSLYKMYITSVEQHERYPTLAEFKEFVRKKCLENDNRIGIVSENTPTDIESVYDHFAEAVHSAGDIDAKEFLRRAQNSINRVDRIVIERKNKISKELAKKYVCVAKRRVNLSTV